MTQILIVSGDLMATSQLGGLARSAGAAVAIRPRLEGPPPAEAPDLVLLDLQWLKESPELIVSQARQLVEAAAPTGIVRIVAFGPHVWKDRLDAAVAAGADAAVSRGELLGAFPALVQRWTAG